MTISRLEAQAAEIADLVAALDSTITAALAAGGRHRADVPVDGVSRVRGVWPPCGPRHVVGDNDWDDAA